MLDKTVEDPASGGACILFYVEDIETGPGGASNHVQSRGKRILAGNARDQEKIYQGGRREVKYSEIERPGKVSP